MPIKRFVIEMEFLGGVKTFLPSDGESGELYTSISLAVAKEDAKLENLRQILHNFNDDACDYPVDQLIGAKVFELVEIK
jgi:hypothetical protein